MKSAFAWMKSVRGRLEWRSSGLFVQLDLFRLRVTYQPKQGLRLNIVQGGSAAKGSAEGRALPERMDSITGARLQDAGLEAFRQELERAWRSRWLAYVPLADHRPAGVNYEPGTRASLEAAGWTSAWRKLMRAEGLWVVRNPADLPVQGPWSDQTVTRVRAESTESLPRYFRAAEGDCYRLRGDGWELIAAPDRMLFRDPEGIGAAGLSSLRFESGTVDYAESGKLPGDAPRVGEVWMHATRAGEADKRFKDNPKLPLMQYGMLRMEQEAGFRLLLLVSNPAAARAVAEACAMATVRFAPDGGPVVARLNA